jgi:hypothetical protein
MTCGAHLHRERKNSGVSGENLQKKPYLKSATSPGQWGPMSEIVLSRLKTRISAHCNKFSQDRWIFAISLNSGGFAYFPRKCGGFFGINSI